MDKKKNMFFPIVIAAIIIVILFYLIATTKQPYVECSRKQTDEFGITIRENLKASLDSNKISNIDALENLVNLDYLCIGNNKLSFDNDYSILNNIKANKEILLELKGSDNTTISVRVNLDTETFKLYQNNKPNGINFSGDFKTVMQHLKNCR